MASRALLVGLSGVSSSGKTTLARLIRDIFPGSFILHEDDFYWSDSKIPTKDGIQDWDCLEAIDVSRLKSCLKYIKHQACPPSDLQSKEDQNSVGECSVNKDVINAWQERVAAMQGLPRVALIDGFLLYSPEMIEIRGQLDVRLFLRTDYKTAKARREARAGYVTVEGFWEDPPGYVDKVVWPNYIKDHSFLFEGGDVEGPYDRSVVRASGIDTVPDGLHNDMTGVLDWACNKILKAMGKS